MEERRNEALNDIVDGKALKYSEVWSVVVESV